MAAHRDKGPSTLHIEGPLPNPYPRPKNLPDPVNAIPLLRREAWWRLIEDRKGTIDFRPMLALGMDDGTPPIDLSLPGTAEIDRDAPDLIPAAVIGIDRFRRERLG